jgi:thiamine-phosphate pyrophosphorylase
MVRYAITDRTRFPGDDPARQAALLHQASANAAAGIDFLQLREKDLPAGELASLARQLLTILRAHGPTKLLIHSRADIAIAVRADGVHLPAAPGPLTPAQVRGLYAAANLPTPMVSVSCHTLAEVARAATSNPGQAATLILFGPVFEKRIAGQLIAPGTGLDLLRSACAAAAPTPVLALGGITRANTPACLASGAAGIAAIRHFATLL